MLRSLLLLMFIIMKTGLLAQQVTTDGYNGRVKRLEEYNFKELQQTGIDLKDGYRIVSIYDSAGYKTKAYSYDEKGALIGKSVYKYDGSKLVEERNYNEQGKYVYANKYRYDKRGNEISLKHYSVNGLLFLRTQSEYDDKGNIVQERSYNAEGNLLNKATWQYDAKGNVAEERIYDADEQETSLTKYKYDAEGRMIEEVKELYGIMLRTVYKYDEQGVLKEEWGYNAEGVRDARIVYEYDDNGIAIKETYYSADDKVKRAVSYKNDYDRYQNLVKRTQLENGREVVILRKELDYYQ